ncbi:MULTISPECIES: hypothetical protein [Mycobacteriaceae]|uniref:Uncharacterized protein n=1 Tax=Mycolicibacterium phocaicum TaxID=319706 RepID=A0A7I7ZQH1_9MYCO|nr:hypothetical protein [Mycolicibacterium phocaicum]TLH80980.1 hypothetical protein C1S79_00805 [Mycolicibacterium phocaicum]BBZ56486.1 hypothetical protein MPHO_34780 [Mycolicibacterium phocaicum]
MLRVAAAGLVLAVGLAPTASADAPALPEVPVSPGTTFVDDPAIVDPHPLAAESWSRLDPEPAVALNISLGSPDCYGVHATAAETGQTVVVTLTAGRRSDREHMVCTMMIMPGTIVVPLANPVGSRAVLTAA